MDLKTLKASGGILSAEPVKKQVTWKGDTFDVHVVRQSFGAIESVIKDLDGGSQTASFISAFIRLGENADEKLTYDDATNLAPELAAEFTRVLKEVNDEDKEKKA